LRLASGAIRQFCGEINTVRAPTEGSERAMATFATDCLAGKAILITGGLGAIGRVAVTRLAEHSAQIAVNDILPEDDGRKIIRESGWPDQRVIYVRADVTRPDQAQLAVARTVERFSRLDVAFCHAGMAHSCPIVTYSEQEWDKILDINLKSAFLVAQASARAMIERGVRGKIIFTSSWVQDVPWPDITPYNVTKSGIKALMRGMARELAAHGIRVNSIAPGIVAVGMAKRQWDTEPDYRRRAEKAIPLGTMQPPESVADAMIFLASGAADYLTGATLLVDGGCSLYPMD
jgi:NAD(P)-dependent dehydrogenase (short-subunit alcohol dehydrogenase family)